MTLCVSGGIFIGMEILDKKLQKRVMLVSKKLGLDRREVINRAVSTYLGSLDDVLSFQGELRMWDILSARTMKKYKF